MQIEGHFAVLYYPGGSGSEGLGLHLHIWRRPGRNLAGSYFFQEQDFKIPLQKQVLSFTDPETVQLVSLKKKNPTSIK